MGLGQITVLDITDTAIHFLQARVEKDRRLIAQARVLDRTIPGPLAEKDLDGLPVQEIEGREVVVVVPRRVVFMKYLDLPASDPEELRRMIGLQIGRQVPYPRERVVFDFVTMKGASGGGYTRVLVAAVNRDYVDQTLQALRAKGLQAHQILVRSFCLLKWYQAVYPQAGGETALIFDSRSGWGEASFVADGQLLLSRHLCWPDGRSAAGIENLRSALDLTRAAFQKRYPDLKLDRVVLLSDHPDAGPLQNALQPHFSCPVESGTLTPARAVLPFAWPGGGRGAGQADPARRMAFAAALGAVAAAGTGLLPNLIPAEVLDRKRSRAQRREIWRVVALAALAVILCFALWALGIWRQSAYLGRLEARIASLEPQVNAARQTMQLSATLAEETRQQVFVSEFIRTLYELTPEEIIYRLVNLEPDGQVTLEGADMSGDAVQRLQRTLLASPYYKNVVLQYATKRKRLNQEYTDFRLTCSLLRPGQGSEVEE